MNIELTKNENVRKIGGLEEFVNVPNDFNGFFDYNAIMPKKGGIKLGGLEGN